MKDQLKQQFDNHGEHDEFELPEGHYERFMDKLSESEKKASPVWKWRLAAGFALLLGLGIGISVMYFDQPGNVIVADNPKSPVKKREIVDPQGDMDYYFSKKVNMKVNELKLYAEHADSAVINESLRELEVLEEEYDELKLKLKQYDGDKQILKAMARNYRTRLKLLDLLLTRLEHNIGPVKQEVKSVQKSI